MPTPPRRPPILLLIAFVALSPLSINIVVPSLPQLPAVFGTDYTRAQLTLTLYLAGIAFGQLVYGPVSDRFGRRPVMIAGLGLFVASSVLALAALSIDMLILARVGQAAGGCAAMVLTRAIVRDAWTREQSASVMGYVTMGMAVAPMLAPALGGVLDELYGWRGAYVVMLGYGTLATLLAVFALSETLGERSAALGAAGLLRGYRSLLASPAFVCYALSTGFNSASFFSFLGGAPYVTQHLMGLTPKEYGLYFIMISMGYMLGNFLSGAFSVRVGLERMVLAGGVITVGAGIAMDVLARVGGLAPLDIFGPMTLGAIGSGMVLPNALAAGVSVDPRAAGAASGLMGFVQMGIGALSTVLVVALQGETADAMVYCVLGSSVLCLVFFLLAWTAQRRQSARQGTVPAASD